MPMTSGMVNLGAMGKIKLVHPI
ncbi:UNVERIFIED_CONTAM: hypothetical protein GTU68_006993 [Idotea baltica]|nr:hypothetical protein [Idotea baltica]